MYLGAAVKVTVFLGMWQQGQRSEMGKHRECEE